MKKLLILLLATFIVLASHAQKDTTSKADTAATMETPLLSYNDVLAAIGEMPMKCKECVDPITKVLIEAIQKRASEYYIKRKEALKKH